MSWLCQNVDDLDGWEINWLGLDDPATFDGFGDAGVATIVLDLETGFRIRYNWITDIEKVRSGKERRVSRNDRARESYEGGALLSGNNPRAIRARMARYAAIGSRFLLALPHEALALSANHSGTTVFVDAGGLALTDWAKTGQRCVVYRSQQFIDAVIQDKTSNTIVLDVDPGTLGNVGGVIMPTVPVYLDPQQNFPRYPVDDERWEIRARAALFDFAPTLASLDLGAATISAGFDGSFVTSRRFGLIGNSITFALVSSGGAPNAGQLSEVIAGALSTTFTFKPGVTTIANLAAALDTSANVKLTGTWTGGSTIASGDAMSGLLSGGKESGDVGTGAPVTFYSIDGPARPVWDRAIDNASTITDSIQAGTEILDHGGIPYAIGFAGQPDWGRALALESNDRIDLQWVKGFMAKVIGRQKSFWLPTWRKDLTFISNTTTTITISSTDGSDFFGWWPSQRRNIAIFFTDGTYTCMQITAAVDNGNGTITVTVLFSIPGFGGELPPLSVSMISWLELCRFESDDLELRFTAAGFSL